MDFETTMCPHNKKIYKAIETYYKIKEYIGCSYSKTMLVHVFPNGRKINITVRTKR